MTNETMTAVPFDRAKIIKFTAAFAVIAVCLAYLVTVGLGKSVVPYMTVPEFSAAGQPDSKIRLTGYVVAGTINRSTDGLSVAFAVGEKMEGKQPMGKPPGVPVAYKGPIPDTFKEGSEVVVEGNWKETSFDAHTLLAKCPSRYEAALAEGKTHPAEVDVSGEAEAATAEPAKP